MSTSSLGSLAGCWARVAEEAGFPVEYDGVASAEAYRANEDIQELIRAHVETTKDMRLFSLLHLLGQASLRIEQVLWPEDYARLTREIEDALRKADTASDRS